MAETIATPLPSRKWRNFEEKFSSEEERLKIGGVQATARLLGFRRDRGMYEPIRLTSGYHVGDDSVGCRTVSRSGVMDGQKVSFEIIGCSTLFEFCRKALAIALRETAVRYPNWYNFEWAEDDAVSMMYHFTSPDRREAAKYCWGLLQQLADDPSFTITERVEISPSDKYGWVPGGPADALGNPVRVEPGHYRMVVVIHGEDLPENFDDRINLSGTGAVFTPDPTPRRYSFQAMQRYIVELNEHEMTLLNAAESFPRSSELDAELHEAISYLDVERIRRLLERGADPNSVVRDETALAHAAETFLWDHIPYEEYQKLEEEGITDYPEEKRIEVYRLLLSWGADPNLFAYWGQLPLDIAVMSHRALETAFLLENGADPNINAYPDEGWYVSSSLSIAVVEESYNRVGNEPDELVQRCQKIVELLKKHGARLYKSDEM